MFKNHWSIHKFGGTSVGNAERYQNVAKLLPLEQDAPRMGIVVSAMKGVTDSLIQLVEYAEKQNLKWKTQLSQLKDQHHLALKALTNQEHLVSTWGAFEKDFQQIEEILKSVELMKSSSMEIVERVSGYGEVWSAQLLNSHLQSTGKNSTWIDARDILVVQSDPHSVEIQWAESQKRMNQWLEHHEENLVVITGFVASTIKGIATTLKRNGSDYSASIFAELLKAKHLSIWTDVDGVLSADPRLVPEAQVLPEISYQEIIELAYFGAKVVHPGTMVPAMKMGIPIQIRNTFNPMAKGTKICAQPNSSIGSTVRGFSIVEDMALFNLEGTGMMGVPGVAEKLFGSLRSEKVNVVLISQASSEHSICFAIPIKDLEKAKMAVEQTFSSELNNGAIDSLKIQKPVAVLAAVGDGMANTPGIAGKFLSALGSAQINIIAIAQGSSERNISVVISQIDAKKALRTVHSRFYLSPYLISIGIIGAGSIGKTLIRQIEDQRVNLLKEKNIDLRIAGYTDSKTMTLVEGPYKESHKIYPLVLGDFLKHVKADHIPHSVLIDCSASNETPKHYVSWLSKGFHIITPNKKGLSGSQEQYDQIKEACKKNQRQFLYSTNVGAGLPFIRTIQEMVLTGDKIHSLEAVLSGTLSFIFNNLDNSLDHSFAEQVNKARNLGYTEPDPRDDLSGADVYRKILILTREMGHKISSQAADVNLAENLVPANLRTLSKEEFISRINELRINHPKNGALRYVAKWSPEKGISVGLQSIDQSHPMATLRSSDNILILKTDRYNQQPLVIQGPGAGPEVTAAGVFSDLLRLVSSIGGSL